jgi:ketosteroid isomerase-like protein
MNPTPHTDAAADTLAVLDFENEACAAYQRGDAQAIDRLVADGYTLTDSRGQISTKAEDLNDARSGSVHYSRFENQDMRVRLYGDTAIVLGRTLVKGVTAGGTPIDVEVQFTDSIVRINGRWQLVAGHVSRLKPKGS